MILPSPLSRAAWSSASVAMVIPQVLKMVTRREAAHDGAHERVNDWQTPRSYRPGALMDAQADVSIFDIPAQARAPRSFDGWWTQSWNRGAAQPKNVAQSGSEQFRSSPRTSGYSGG